MTDSLLKKCVENDVIGFKEELKEMIQTNFDEKIDKIEKEMYKESLTEGCTDKDKLEEEKEDDEESEDDKDKKDSDED